jgi:hypothetical protein
MNKILPDSAAVQVALYELRRGTPIGDIATFLGATPAELAVGIIGWLRQAAEAGVILDAEHARTCSMLAAVLDERW